ncbi:MAG: manganese efflux pump [Clostridia bacterium]|nr:manganese efflux pump [Clostridia bacterium]
MGIIDIILIGVALATDAFALTIANCTAYEKSLNRKKEWAMPLSFALFQFAMPIFGFLLGGLVADFIQSFAKFLTAGIFFILSAKIFFDIIEERRKDGETPKRKAQAFTVGVLILQAVVKIFMSLLTLKSSS